MLSRKKEDKNNLPFVKKFAAGCCTVCWVGAGAELNMSANGLPKPSRSSEALLCGTAACVSAAPNKSTILVFACAAGGDDKNGFVAAVGDPIFCYKLKSTFSFVQFFLNEL